MAPNDERQFASISVMVWCLQVQGKLKLERDLAAEDLETINSLMGSKYGEMWTYTGAGSPIDWLVKSWLGA